MGRGCRSCSATTSPTDSIESIGPSGHMRHLDVTDMRDPSRYAFVPGSATYPTIIGGDGCLLHTSDGRSILDGAAGAVVGNIGWGRAEVADAAREAMAAGGYVVPLWPTPARLALHDALVELKRQLRSEAHGQSASKLTA